MATLRWMGVPEAEVRMVEGSWYEKTTAIVVVGEGASEEFEVKIGLRQSSVLSQLLFIAWWRMAKRSYRRHWRSGTGCLPDTCIKLT